jgi:predicted metal-dependent peptidase
VVQCDAHIQKIEVYESWETPLFSNSHSELLGRGGTDFRPVFDWVQKDVIPVDGVPDLIVYLTDGFGSFPTKWNACPTVWLVHSHASEEFPFGSVIRIDGPK